jgi:hypothetical protein
MDDSPVFHLIEHEFRRARSHQPKKYLLHLMDRMKPPADRSVGQRRGMSLKCPPMLCIRPGLVSVQFVKTCARHSRPAWLLEL